MKAALYYDVNDVRIETVETTEISSKDILVQVKVCGICASDYRSVRVRKSHYVSTPKILGHELSGEIAEVGKDVEHFNEGMRVTLAPGVGCHKCFYCRTGRDNLCMNRLTLGANIDGGFAEYVKVPAAYLEGVVPIPDDLTFEEAAFTEPLSCCLHGMLRAKPKIGDTVVILGAGPIGLLHLQLAKAMGAGTVIVSESIEKRIKLARSFGAEVINFKEEDPIKRLVELTGGQRADSVIVAVGNTIAIQQAFQMIKPAGTIVIFGGVPQGMKMEIDPNIIHYLEINVTGSIDSTVEEFRGALRLIAKRIIKVKPLISHELPLEEILKGFDLIGNRESIKVLVKP